MNNDKIVDRIRKLYAMAQDTSSPNEAAIAAKRARSLMDQHGITLENLSTSEFDEVNAGTKKYKQVPQWFNLLVFGVAKYNDCQSKFKARGQIVFQGFDSDVVSANLMLDYLIQSMERQLKRHKEDSGITSRGMAGSFRKGFCSDMQKRLMAMVKERQAESEAAKGSGNALVVVKNKLVAEQFGHQLTVRKRANISDSGGYNAGKAASQRTGINRHVSGTSQKQLA